MIVLVDIGIGVLIFAIGFLVYKAALSLGQSNKSNKE